MNGILSWNSRLGSIETTQIRIGFGNHIAHIGICGFRVRHSETRVGIYHVENGLIDLVERVRFSVDVRKGR